jgi:hypothetical protein
MSGTSPDSMNSDVIWANTATPISNNVNGMKELRTPKSKKSYRTRRPAGAGRIAPLVRALTAFS